MHRSSLVSLVLYISMTHGNYTFHSLFLPSFLEIYNCHPIILFPIGGYLTYRKSQVLFDPIHGTEGFCVFCLFRNRFTRGMTNRSLNIQHARIYRRYGTYSYIDSYRDSYIESYKRVCSCLVGLDIWIFIWIVCRL